MLEPLLHLGKRLQNFLGDGDHAGRLTGAFIVLLLCLYVIVQKWLHETDGILSQLMPTTLFELRRGHWKAVAATGFASLVCFLIVWPAGCRGQAARTVSQACWI